MKFNRIGTRRFPKVLEKVYILDLGGSSLKNININTYLGFAYFIVCKLYLH